MERTRATGGLILLTVIVVSVMIGLHRMGTIEVFRIDWSNPLGWLETAKPADAVAAVARSVGLAIGYWTVAGALLYALAAMRHGPTDNLRWLAHPGIRRLVDTALATALTASLAASPFQPALAAEQPPVVYDINEDGIPIPHLRLEFDASDTDRDSSEAPQADLSSTAADPASVAAEVTTPAAQFAAAQVGAAPGSSPAVPSTNYTVQSGDNLWAIAEQHLAAEQGSSPAAAAHSAYWRRLVTANQPTLRSGDPNLIYPGEIITLPAIEAAR